MKRICMTGGRGFIGECLVRALAQAGHALTLAVRRCAEDTPDAGIPTIEVGDIGPLTDWRPALEGCDTVVHLAGQTPGAGVAPERFDAVNDLGTARLAEQCAEVGVKTFVFASSIFAVVDHVFDGVVDDKTAPRATTPYGRSKLAAESHVDAFAGEGRVGVSLRPPLVFGARAKGNWHALQRLAASGLPLPFGLVRNRRSLISVENLCNAFARVVREPVQAGVFCVADADVVSLADMLRFLRAGMGLSPRLLPVPPVALEVGLGALGRTEMAQSLLGDLTVDASRFREVYGWTPPVRTEDAVHASGRAFVAAEHGAGHQDPLRPEPDSARRD